MCVIIFVSCGQVDIDVLDCFYLEVATAIYSAKMVIGYLLKRYGAYLRSRWEKTIMWDLIEPYQRPKKFMPVVIIYIGGFYTGVIGAAIIEQRYKVINILY